MSGVRITQDNLGALSKALKRLSGLDVLVGIPSDKAQRDDGEFLNNAELGYIHSTGGTVSIGGAEVTLPPRPFLDMGIEDTQDVTTDHLKAAADFALSGQFEAAQREMERAGMVAANGAKKVIGDGDRLAPLSDKTKAKRLINGQDIKPLYDTGSLLRSITYVVRNKGE
ncbi:MAG TPA: hypothetical protein DIT05_19915 [Morganella sp. (in: Bacteria)]|nr:hypothetical protein [Morganella sp. (in: enterobacteria)]